MTTRARVRHVEFSPAVFHIPRLLMTVFVGLIGSVGILHADDLKPGLSPVDNPLKGLVPYSDPTPDRFPHSMEFSYIPLSDLMLEMDQFQWDKLEELLNDVASRGNQAVFRIYLEYPDKTDGIPKFLEKRGLKVHEYLNTNTAPFPPAKVRTPDYESPLLREALANFIAAMGKKYDNDPRIAYIHAGLLGTWGEWHTYPKEDLWASKETQSKVLEAYRAAFHKTPVLLRYPAGPDHWNQAANAHLPFGYHDDSFAWATLDTGKKKDDWFFVPALKSAGQDAIDKWKTQPIGGEIRPELWGKIFDSNVKAKQAQDFDTCVRETHVTWLMDTGMFEKKASAERYDRAIDKVRRMGYDFYVKSTTIKRQGKSIDVRCDVLNQGVAPFYREWALELGLLDSGGTVLHRWPVDWALTGLLPGSNAREWKTVVNLPNDANSKDAVFALRVINPLANGKPLRFANESQDRHAPGWLTLGAIQPE